MPTEERRQDYISIQSYLSEMRTDIKDDLKNIYNKLEDVVKNDSKQDEQIKNIRSLIKTHILNHWKFVTVSISLVAVLLTIFMLIK